MIARAARTGASRFENKLQGFGLSATSRVMMIGLTSQELSDIEMSVLSRWTTTPDVCWFAVAQGGAVLTDHPTLSLPDREYWLINGPIELAAQNMAAEPFEQSANLWWPADRAWCVVTDIDLVSTYVGGSAACIAELFAVDGLEVVPAAPGQRTTWDADQVNPTPPDAPDS